MQIANEEKKTRDLRRMKRVATGMLVAMLVLLVASSLAHKATGWTLFVYVHAFAEAATVGGLADWFAVTALFRYPLGLPIPHTAIIPRNRDSIAEGLGRFVQNNFLNTETLSGKIRSYDIVGKAETWLAKSDNSMRVAERITKSLNEFVHSADDANVREFVRSNIQNIGERVDLAEIGGQIMTVVVENDHDHRIFDEILKLLRDQVDQNKDLIAKTIREELPAIAKPFSNRVNDRVMVAINRTLDDLLVNRDHPLRQRVHAEVDRFIERLKTDAEFQKQIDTWKREMLQNPAVQQYFDRVWNDVKELIKRDTSSPHSEIKRRIFRAIYGLSNSLLNDPVVRNRLNNYVYEAATQLLVSNRDAIANLISQTIRNWDEETLVNKLELQVGKDLQFIRVNGTLVGGLLGILLQVFADLVGIS